MSKRRRFIQISLLITIALSIALFVFLAHLQPVAAADQSGEVTGIVQSAIELEWETTQDYCDDLLYPYRDICITLSGSAPVGSGSGIVTVRCNNPNGYFVTLKMRNDNAALNRLISLDVSEFIAPTTSASLDVNSWGFYAGSTANYLAVPLASTAGANIISAAYTPNKGALAGTDEITVTFGARIDFLLPTHTSYSNQVIFTAAANAL